VEQMENLEQLILEAEEEVQRLVELEQEDQGLLLLEHQDQLLFQQAQEQTQLQHYRHQLEDVK
jgi:hypothetical protein